LVVGSAGGEVTAPAQQLVEWVDEDGRVRGIVTRARVRAENLLHRSVFVVVWSSRGEILVHRRAEWKDVWPGYWDLAVGGVVSVAEQWPAAARRELAEEIGLEAVELDDLGGFRYGDRQVEELAHVFAVRGDGPFRFEDGEVTAVEWVPVANLREWVDAHVVCPDSVAGVLPVIPGLSPWS
jgi:isopentenyldiphosphate isomerase